MSQLDERETEVRPITRQSNRSAQMTAMRPRNIHFSMRESRAGLTEGMTPFDGAKAVAGCVLFVAAGFSLLWAFGWCIGHFMKGWW